MIDHTTGTLTADSFFSLGFESLLGRQELQSLLLDGGPQCGAGIRITWKAC